MKFYAPVAAALLAVSCSDATPVTRIISDNDQGLYVEVRSVGRNISWFRFDSYKNGKNVAAISYRDRDIDKNGLPDLKTLSVDCINRERGLFGKDYYPGYRQLVWDTNGAMHIASNGECSIDLDEIRKEIERKVMNAAENGTLKNW